MSKVTTLCQKLIRVASPSSGATEPERQNATLRIGELVVKHGLVVCEKGEVRARAPDLPDMPIYEDDEASWAPVQYTMHKIRMPSFYPSIAAMRSFCSHCGKTVYSGDRVMRRLLFGVIEYQHAHCHGTREAST